MAPIAKKQRARSPWFQWVLLLLALAPCSLLARPFTVMVYNVENLHDADGVAVYDDYQPARYTPAHALTKVQNIAAVVARAGSAGQPPEVILFQEIEIDHTPRKSPSDYPALLKRYADTTIERMLGPDFTPEIADLPAEALLLKAFADRGLVGYSVVTGGDGEDGNVGDGADTNAGTLAELRSGPAIKNVVFTRFPIKAVRTFPMRSARNLLEVQLDVEGYPLTVFNNHWKAGASDSKMELIRLENATVLRRRIDELLTADPNADIVIGGDLNSHYNQKRRYRKLPATGINDGLGSQGNELAIRGPTRDLYNLWFELAASERGSDVYAGEWGTLMHLLVTRGLYDQSGVRYVDNSFAVARFPGLNADAADLLPVRWSAEGAGGRGYSDHFPLTARFQTVTDGQPGKFTPLTREAAGGEDGGDATARKVDLAKTDFTAAVELAQLPAEANLRDGTWTGKLFRVKAQALEDRLLRIEVRGQIYDVYGPRQEIRERLYAQRREYDGALSFYGELGTFKGTWQFLVKSTDWVK